ncbi:MAG TPA: AraC family transcriptional regulator [Cyclobacteriaceae bacterium]|nr:AraC family transcriptional regulator [Cyclobacteriaceae bacterium]
MKDNTRPIDLVEKGLMEIAQKKHFKGRFEKIDEELFILEAETGGDSKRSFLIPVAGNYIIFLFCPEGKILVRGPLSETRHILTEKNSFLLSKPNQDWDLYTLVEKNSVLQVIAVSIGKLHSFFGLFVGESADNSRNSREYLKGFRVNSYYSEKTATPVIKVCIHQLFQAHGMVDDVSRSFFRKSKILEFLAIYMNGPRTEETWVNHCPYIIDSLQEEKIRNAEQIILNNMKNPPTIRELAKLVGTNEFRLKSDFRNIFGETIYGRLMRYRMDTARDLLDRKKLQVQEVSERLGYSNSSHFISAFKKQFGITPKKYLQGN